MDSNGYPTCRADMKIRLTDTHEAVSFCFD
jgi:hypothetical protein